MKLTKLSLIALTFCTNTAQAQETPQITAPPGMKLVWPVDLTK